MRGESESDAKYSNSTVEVAIAIMLKASELAREGRAEVLQDTEFEVCALTLAQLTHGMAHAGERAILDLSQMTLPVNGMTLLEMCAGFLEGLASRVDQGEDLPDAQFQALTRYMEVLHVLDPEAFAD